MASPALPAVPTLLLLLCLVVSSALLAPVAEAARGHRNDDDAPSPSSGGSGSGCGAGAGEPSSAWSPLWVFGDSYADTGNLGDLGRELTHAWYDPYGDTFPGRPTGRFSDGRVLTDFIAGSRSGACSTDHYPRLDGALPFVRWGSGLPINTNTMTLLLQTVTLTDRSGSSTDGRWPYRGSQCSHCGGSSAACLYACLNQ